MIVWYRPKNSELLGPREENVETEGILMMLHAFEERYG